MEIPLVIGPFIEFRGPDNRPEQKTAHEDQYEDFHIVRDTQYLIDAVIAKSIAGSPIYAWTYPGTRAWPVLGGARKEVEIGVGVGLDVRVGGART